MDVVPLIVGPLILIGPAGFWQNGNADVLDFHPGLHLIKFGNGQPSGVPGKHTNPTMILVIAMALDQRGIDLCGLGGKIRGDRMLQAFGKIIWNVAAAAVPGSTQGKCSFAGALVTTFDHFVLSSMPGRCMSACFRPRYMLLCAATGNDCFLPCG